MFHRKGEGNSMLSGLLNAMVVLFCKVDDRVARKVLESEGCAFGTLRALAVGVQKSRFQLEMLRIDYCVY